MKDGGPAFPANSLIKSDGLPGGYGQVVESASQGMTLRDYFAAKAMHAFISSKPQDNGFEADKNFAIKYAYQVADAMIAERNKIQ